MNKDLKKITKIHQVLYATKNSRLMKFKENLKDLNDLDSEAIDFLYDRCMEEPVAAPAKMTTNQENLIKTVAKFRAKDFNKLSTIVRVVQATSNKELKELTTRLKFIGDWDEKLFDGVYEMCLKDPASKSIFSSADRVKKHENFAYGSQYTSAQIKKAGEFRKQIKK